MLERIGPSFKGGCFFNFIWGPLSIVATFCIPPPHSTLLFESCYKSCFELPEEQCSIGLSNRLQVKSCKDQLQLFPYDYFWERLKLIGKKWRTCQSKIVQCQQTQREIKLTFFRSATALNLFEWPVLEKERICWQESNPGPFK